MGWSVGLACTVVYDLQYGLGAYGLEQIGTSAEDRSSRQKYHRCRAQACLYVYIRSI